MRRPLGTTAFETICCSHRSTFLTVPQGLPSGKRITPSGTSDRRQLPTVINVHSQLLYCVLFTILILGKERYSNLSNGQTNKQAIFNRKK